METDVGKAEVWAAVKWDMECGEASMTVPGEAPPTCRGNCHTPRSVQDLYASCRVGRIPGGVKNSFIIH